jgi:hypothetical protein
VKLIAVRATDPAVSAEDLSFAVRWFAPRRELRGEFGHR